MCNKCELNECGVIEDHRELGKKLGYFTFDDMVGAGFPIWLEKGNTVREIVIRYINALQQRYGISMVKTPVFGCKALYETSGHLDHYQTNIFPPIKMENVEYILRPMTCPHHILLVKKQILTHKSFPIAIGENSMLYRNEYSGGLLGLERVRCMELIDTHVFVLKDQIKAEFTKLTNLIFEVIKVFKIELDSIVLSVRDPNDKEKFYKDDQMWDESEGLLSNLITEILEGHKEEGYKFLKDVGGAAFYGPKIDFQIHTKSKKVITLATIQLDYLLAKKFELTYTDKDQNVGYPVIIHVGIIGTLERFIAYLLERYAGNLPVWLTPIQVELIPINNEKHEDICLKVKQMLDKEGIRAHVDMSANKAVKKISSAQMQKIPYQIMLGDHEIESLDSICYKEYGKEGSVKCSMEEFIWMVKGFNKVVQIYKPTNMHKEYQ